MFRPRVIPVLLLKGEGLVKTVAFKKPNYIGDPMNAIKIFNDLEADELAFLDITATAENRMVSLDLVRDIGEEAFMPFSVGGGINTLDKVKKVINSGAEKVIINTAAYVNKKLIEESANLIGSQSTVVSIDVKKDFWGREKVFIFSGMRSIELNPVQYVKQIVESGAGEIIINSINREGTGQGYDLELIEKISNAVDVPVIALGGAASLDDFRKAYDFGASGVAAGSMFVYQGPRKAVLINYPSKEELNKIFLG